MSTRVWNAIAGRVYVSKRTNRLIDNKCDRPTCDRQNTLDGMWAIPGVIQTEVGVPALVEKTSTCESFPQLQKELLGVP